MPVQRKSPRATLIQQKSIQQAQIALQKLPEKQKNSWSLREAIERMQDTITAALDRGYSYEDISKMLTDKGVKISPSSLKSYLAASRRNSKAASSTPGRRKKASAHATSPAITAPAPSSKRDTRPKSATAAKPGRALSSKSKTTPAASPTSKRRRKAIR